VKLKSIVASSGCLGRRQQGVRANLLPATYTGNRAHLTWLVRHVLDELGRRDRADTAVHFSLAGASYPCWGRRWLHSAINSVFEQSLVVGEQLHCVRRSGFRRSLLIAGSTCVFRARISSTWPIGFIESHFADVGLDTSFDIIPTRFLSGRGDVAPRLAGRTNCAGRQ